MNIVYIIVGVLLILIAVAFLAIQFASNDDSDKPNWL